MDWQASSLGLQPSISFSLRICFQSLKIAEAMCLVRRAKESQNRTTSTFASLSQWYDHARTVWQTLSMCGTDLLQFRTMR